MEHLSPTSCAQCSRPLPADYLVVDQGISAWFLCGWNCVHEFSKDPHTGKAIQTAHGPLHKAWVAGARRWYVYRAAKGAVVRKITEHLVPFRTLAGAVTAAKAEAGPGATEIATHG
jgi:hypothetical protein